MIEKWSKQDLIKDLEHVRDGGNEYIDDRGKISNHELTEPINLIGLIVFVLLMVRTASEADAFPIKAVWVLF